MDQYSLHTCNTWEDANTRFEWSFPSNYNAAWDLCDRQPINSLALVYAPQHAAEERYTFGELQQLSRRLAAFLSTLRVDPGVRVAIHLPQVPEAALTNLAVFRLAAISVPISPLFGPDGLRTRLRDSQANVLVTDGEGRRRLTEVHRYLTKLQHVLVIDDAAEGDEHDFTNALRTPPLDEPRPTTSDSPALLIYTSGSEGEPKGVLLPHRTIPGRLPGLSLAHHPLPQPRDLFWSPADWAWVAGLLDSLFGPWLLGVPVVIDGHRGPFDPLHAVELMERYTVRNVCIPPTALNRIRHEVGHVYGRFDLYLRSIHAGGEPLPTPVFDWARRELAVTVNEIYGMTEASFLVGNAAGLMQVRSGSMGRSYPGHRIAVVDEQGKPVPDDTPGILAVHRADPVLFLEYWQDPAATTAAFREEWFLSGDIVRRDPMGYVWYIGRRDDAIKFHGYRIAPVEIEQVLLTHHAVADAAVVGVTGSEGSTHLKAFVQLAPDTQPSADLAERLRQHVRERLAVHQAPHEVAFLDEIPRTVTGKIRRAELRAFAA